MAVVDFGKAFFDFTGIREVPVVGKENSERGVDIKGLTFQVVACAPLRRVAHVSDTGVADKVSHIPCAKDVAHKALGFKKRKAVALHRADAGSILSAVLQQKERIIDLLIDRTVCEDSDNAAHSGLFIPFLKVGSLGHFKTRGEQCGAIVLEARAGASEAYRPQEDPVNTHRKECDAIAAKGKATNGLQGIGDVKNHGNA